MVLKEFQPIMNSLLMSLEMKYVNSIYSQLPQVYLTNQKYFTKCVDWHIVTTTQHTPQWTYPLCFWIVSLVVARKSHLWQTYKKINYFLYDKKLDCLLNDYRKSLSLMCFITVHIHSTFILEFWITNITLLDNSAFQAF